MFRSSHEIRSELYRTDMDAFAYRPPIEIIKGDLEARMQEGVLRAVQKFDVNVDEEELRKALAYDRAQYEKGYADAMRFATDTNIGGKWIPVTERLPDNNEHDWVLAQVVEDNGFMHIPKVMEYRKQRNDWYEETYGWLSEHNGAFTVTHWMPLPPAPKE